LKAIQPYAFWKISNPSIRPETVLKRQAQFQMKSGLFSIIFYQSSRERFLKIGKAIT